MRFVSATIPDVPYEVGMAYLRQAYTEFAKRSSLLVSHQHTEMQRDVREYPLHAPEGYEIFGLLRYAGTHGYILYPNAHRWFAYFGHDMQLVGNDRFVLRNAPSRDGDTLEIVLHLIPTECADTIPSEISTPFGFGIAKGAMAELLGMPGKPWSDPRASERYRREFSITCMSGRNLHLTNRGATRVTMDSVRVL